MSTLQSRVDDLKAELDDVETTTKGGNWMKCMSVTLMAGIATPFILALVLYFLKPGFVQKKKGSTTVRDSKKLIQWTVVFTVVIWISLYLYTYCTSAGGSVICLDK